MLRSRPVRAPPPPSKPAAHHARRAFVCEPKLRCANTTALYARNQRIGRAETNARSRSRGASIAREGGGSRSKPHVFRRGQADRYAERAIKQGRNTREKHRSASITGAAAPCGSTRHPVIHPPRPCTQILHFWPRNRVLAQIGPTPTAHRLFRNRRPGLSPRQSMLLLRKWAVAVPERGLVAKNARFPRTFHPQTPYASHRCAGRSTQRERSTQHARRRASLRLHDTQPPYPTARTFAVMAEKSPEAAQ